MKIAALLLFVVDTCFLFDGIKKNTGFFSTHSSSARHLTHGHLLSPTYAPLHLYGHGEPGILKGIEKFCDIFELECCKTQKTLVPLK